MKGGVTRTSEGGQLPGTVVTALPEGRGERGGGRRELVEIGLDGLARRVGGGGAVSSERATTGDVSGHHVPAIGHRRDL